MTADEVRAILADVHYRGWRFKVMTARERSGEPTGILVEYEVPDSEAEYLQEVSGDPKLFLSRLRLRHGAPMRFDDATREEVLVTMRDLVIAAETHEAAERFRYKGRSIFDPHARRPLEEALRLVDEQEVKR